MAGLVIGFTSRNISNWERAHGGEDFRTMLTPQVSSLVEVIKVGNNNCSDDRAFEILDGYLDVDGNDVFSACIELGGILVKKGMLFQSQLEKVKLQIEELNQ